MSLEEYFISLATSEFEALCATGIWLVLRKERKRSQPKRIIFFRRRRHFSLSLTKRNIKETNEWFAVERFLQTSKVVLTPWTIDQITMVFYRYLFYMVLGSP